MSTTETKWWAAPGAVDNHTYTLEVGGTQRCHLCGKVEQPLRKPTGDERTDRAAMHLVHGVLWHLDATAAEWNGQRR